MTKTEGNGLVIVSNIAAKVSLLSQTQEHAET
jgi:hypothetical protein